MNVKRFTARTSRDALNLVRRAFGEDAVVLSTRPCAEGVEVLAMAPEGMQHIEHLAGSAPEFDHGGAHGRAAAAGVEKAAATAAPQRAAAAVQTAATAPAARSFAARSRVDAPVAAPRAQAAEREPVHSAVDQDVEQLAMSTLSFQDYVRERMLRRRRTEMAEAAAAAAPAPVPNEPTVARLRAATPTPPVLAAAPVPASAAPAAAARREPMLRDESVVEPQAARPMPEAHRDQMEMMSELRSMKGLIEQRFGALAFMEKLQRSPAQAHLTQKLLDCGFSPALIRKLGDGLPTDIADPQTWAAGVLERNLVAAESEPAIEDVAGVFAMIGSTGVGKTTSTAKIAAAFASRHGAGNLGLITLDAYRIAAHEQLRTYGRILGVPVHTAHDRASLEDLLDLLSAKKMVLIDTAGMAQRDSRTRELLEMVSHRSIQKLLVVNAASQGETIEDVMVSWRASACRGIVLSKVDEAVKLGPVLDTLIRHKLRVVGVANGQRVPEDWHRLSAQALVQRALRATAAPAYRLDANDVNLVFAGLHSASGSEAARVLHS
jgi:flagellar biosynthesis protein FlhF